LSDKKLILLDHPEIIVHYKTECFTIDINTLLLCSICLSKVKAVETKLSETNICI